MHWDVDGSTVVLKLDQGEELPETLQAGLEEAGVTSGLVLGGIGALREVELGWFDPDARTYEKRTYPESHELISLQGSVTLEADPPLHLHCALGGPHLEVVGGHLYRGTVSVLAEISVRNLSGLRLTREENPRTGLRELTIRKAR